MNVKILFPVQGRTHEEIDHILEVQKNLKAGDVVFRIDWDEDHKDYKIQVQRCLEDDPFGPQFRGKKRPMQGLTRVYMLGRIPKK
jgi:hypothetical protein